LLASLTDEGRSGEMFIRRCSNRDDRGDLSAALRERNG
jgi:hypothetical protein